MAIDMETSALYQVGWLFNIPTLAFRGISNALSDSGREKPFTPQQAQTAADNAAKVLETFIGSIV